VTSGDWVLVRAAAGGAGTVTRARAEVCGGEGRGDLQYRKVDLSSSVGADVVVDYIKDDYVSAVMATMAGAGVAAVFDDVGKTMFDKSLECVAVKGSLVRAVCHLVVFPVCHGERIDSRRRLSAKNIKLVRPTLLNYVATREKLEKNTNDVFNFMIEGHIKVNIYEIYSLQDVSKAHQDLERRKTMGKLLLKP
jgi:NADPH2:quinone reductase